MVQPFAPQLLPVSPLDRLRLAACEAVVPAARPHTSPDRCTLRQSTLVAALQRYRVFDQKQLFRVISRAMFFSKYGYEPDAKLDPFFWPEGAAAAEAVAQLFLGEAASGGGA